jgi:transcription elongation GreA/GreB family factor
MSHPPAKPAVHGALKARLEEELAVLEAMVAAARDEATSAESRPENKYDTRAVEASYLAAGQGQRLATLRQLVAWARGLQGEPQRRAQVGALVRVATDAGERWVVLAPSGGPTVTVSGVAVATVSTRSPLGRALLGCADDDAIEVDGPSGPYEAEVVEVH